MIQFVVFFVSILIDSIDTPHQQQELQGKLEIGGVADFKDQGWAALSLS